MKLLHRFYRFAKSDKNFSLYLVLLLGTGFLLLTIFVHLLPNSFIDVEFSEEMQEHRNPILDGLMKSVSIFGHPWIALSSILITALSFFIAQYRREALFILFTLLSAGIGHLLKIVVDRPRPTADLVQIIENAKYQSFPSGHTIFYISFFGFLTFLMYRLKNLPLRLRWLVSIFSLLLIFAVPFSRVYLGAHWLTDVAAGFLVGLLCLYGVIRGYLYQHSPEFPDTCRRTGRDVDGHDGLLG